MFEAAEVGHRVSKEDFKTAVPQLRVDLINTQYDLQEADFSVLVLIAGDDFLGCDALLERLYEWMDARYLDTHVFVRPTEEEREHPRFWRYWRRLPPKGRIGVHYGGWPIGAVADRYDGLLDDARLFRRLMHVRRFERDLADDGTLLLKFWLHLPKDAYAKRLKKARKDPDKAWRLGEEDVGMYEAYDAIRPIAARMLRKTSSEEAPWQVIESTNPEYRDLTVATTIRDAVRARLDAGPTSPEPVVRTASVTTVRSEAAQGILGTLDLSKRLDRAEYKEQLNRLQARMRKLSRKAHDEGIATVLVFEGSDAAGKGGAIRRLTSPVPVRLFQVVPIAAPTDEEKARHYLWRFWRRLPRAGHMTIFDRSWYGRVLVERVEGFAREDEWRRAYEEIRDFEEQLVEHGMVLEKFWLQIDPDEQLKRFQAREKTPYKKYKITEEDYRNRERQDEYVVAVDDMVARTSTDVAPWTLVPANDKRYARVQVLRTVVKALKRALK